MKKLLALFLALVMLFSVAAIFAGCEDSGKKKNTSSSSKDDEEEDDDETTPPEPTVPEGNQIGNRCYGMDLQIVDGNGATGETINPTKTGKVTVINFWGTWCNPCVAELPHFNEAAKNYDISIIAIHSKQEKDTMPAYIAQHYPDSPIIFAWDKEGSDPYADEFYMMMGNVQAYPYTVVLDANGIITFTEIGSMTYETLESAILEAGAAAIVSDDDTEENKETAENSTDRLKTVTDGKLIVATNAAFPPYEYIENGNVVGIDIEIALAIADKLGLELQIEDMEYDSMFEALQNNQADISISGIGYTDTWEPLVDFSDSYIQNTQLILVSADSQLTSVNDLFTEDAYHTIGVIRDTTANIYALFDIEDSGLGVVMRYNKAEDAIANLISGKLDCVIMYDALAETFAAEYEELYILDTYVEEEYQIGVSEDNPQLLMVINDIVQELKDDGTIDQIIAKHTWG